MTEVIPAESPGFGLYVHWPFCRSKCPYCDFNSHVRESVDQQRWRRALLQELAHYGQLTRGRQLDTIFFGGGTPSLMPPETVNAVLETAGGYWDIAPDLEVTLEANPTSSEAARFAEFAAAGVNRLSIGVQALNDRDLAFLGRQHSAAEALAAVGLARDAVPRFSFDLIYARPGQELSGWRDELDRALAEGPEHISLYQLTIEEGTAFHGARRRGELSELPEAAATDLFEFTQTYLSRNGLPGYEISNHARPGAACRHNLIYWHYGDYVGIGPGAHGRLTFDSAKHATRQHRAPEVWLERVESQGHATQSDSLLTIEERLSELLMMGLRLLEGVPRSAFFRETGDSPERVLDQSVLSMLQEIDLVTLDQMGLRATAEGRKVLNSVLVRLLD